MAFRARKIFITFEKRAPGYMHCILSSLTKEASSCFSKRFWKAILLSFFRKGLSYKAPTFFKSSCNHFVTWFVTFLSVDLSVGWEGERSWEILGVQHGNWSAWGNWSECSTETWAGVRSRSRTCTNPLPRSGGRTCVGDSMQYEPCSLEIQGKVILRILMGYWLKMFLPHFRSCSKVNQTY